MRDRQITPPELSGGTFTVSNLGMYGIERFTAIINPPQAAILTVGALEKKPAVDERGRVVARDLMTLTLVCDHRILYGADGAAVPRARAGAARAAALAGALALPMADAEPRVPATLDEEIISAEQADVESQLTDEDRLGRVLDELRAGFEALGHVGAAVSVFGSARTPADHPEYALARETSRLLGDAGFSIITGGGPGDHGGRQPAAPGVRRASRSGSTSSCPSSRG